MNQNLDLIWSRFVATRALELREKLVLSYVHLVRYVLNRMFPSDSRIIEQRDLENEGIIGLIEAVDRFDPQKKVKFETFAIHRIRGAILDALRATDWAPRSVRDNAKRIEKVISEQETILGRSPTESEIARRLGMDVASYQRLLDSVASIRFISLSAEFKNQDEESTVNEEFIVNPNQSNFVDEQENEEYKKIIMKAIKALPKKERLVLALYYYEKLTMKEIATVLGVNESRVSQLHTQAILRLRSVVELTPV